MNKLQDTIIQYLTQNKTKLIADLPDFVQKERLAATARFMQEGFPTLKDEKWRKKTK